MRNIVKTHIDYLSIIGSLKLEIVKTYMGDPSIIGSLNQNKMGKQSYNLYWRSLTVWSLK